MPKFWKTIKRCYQKGVFSEEEFVPMYFICVIVLCALVCFFSGKYYSIYFKVYQNCSYNDGVQDICCEGHPAIKNIFGCSILGLMLLFLLIGTSMVIFVILIGIILSIYVPIIKLISSYDKYSKEIDIEMGREAEMIFSKKN